jgi:ketosteroid isomerase-like protein
LSLIVDRFAVQQGDAAFDAGAATFQGGRVMATRDVIEKYYDCVNRGAWDEWLTLFSDDVVGDEQLAGHFAGIDVLRGAVTVIRNGYRIFHMYPQQMIIDGDAACVVWHCDAANASGVPIAYADSNRQVIGANYFQLQNGKIVYMRTIHDSLPFRPFIEQTQPQASSS